MKIVHICLACFYFEGMGYQENLLPKYHAECGNEVSVLTTDFSSAEKHNAVKRDKDEYINQDGIHVKYIKRSKRYGYYSRYNDYEGVYSELNHIKPEVIFVHGGQFVALKDVIKYVKDYPDVKLYIDQHGDYYNSSVSSLKNKIVQKYIYGYWIKKAERYTAKYWGVTPWRCQYLNEVYGISKEKIGLLVMGGDDEKIRFDESPKIKEDVRKELSLTDKDFVIVTGGKIDRTKNIHLLMQAVSELEGETKLIVFGQPNNEMENIINELSKDGNIRFLGWIPADKAYDYFLASDLAVFPGTHSVLWEQACACGIPCVFKDWEGMHHVDVGGNCQFLHKDSTEEIKEVISEIIGDKEKYNKMKQTAEKSKKDFFYSEIAKKAIEQ